MYIKIRRILSLIILVFFILGLSLYGAFWVAERYFFDKLFFYKSTYFGYFLPNIAIDYQKYGHRAKDLSYLFDTLRNNPPLNFEQCSIETKVLDNKLTVALIGDSYIWGQGLKNNQRAAVILERELSQKITTEVLSYGHPGDSIVDNYLKYRFLKVLRPDIDIYVFGMVNNDFLIQEKNIYSPVLSKQIESWCPGEMYYQPKFVPFRTVQEIPYGEQLAASSSEKFSNICIVKKVAALLPRDALYFNFDGYYESEQLDIYTEILTKNGLQVVTTKDRVSAQELEKRAVSKTEGHPSYSMNKAYARILAEEIIQKINPAQL